MMEVHGIASALAWMFWLAVAVAGCKQGDVSTDLGASRGPPNCTLEPQPLRIQTRGRVVVIGDLHGDVVAARAALQAARAIDADDRWVGGSLVVVQTGDMLDRGDDEVALLGLFESVRRASRAAGGDVVQLIGNHELMNAVADFRFVTPKGLAAFGGRREDVMRPGGSWATRFAAHEVVVIISGPHYDTVISHAGITADWVDHLDEVNQATRCWLAGQDTTTRRPAVYLSNDSPVWTRVWGRKTADCAALNEVLSRLRATQMVVAHTPQPGITSVCNGALWRIDTGLSSYYNGPVQVLELGRTPTIITGQRSKGGT